MARLRRNMGGPVRSSAALEAVYRKKILALVDEMHRSVMWFVRAAWRKHPERLAQDASPIAALKQSMDRLARRWERKFQDAAPEMAKYFSKRVESRVTGDMDRILKDAGISVDFKTSRKVQQVLGAAVDENVSLIKSIPVDYISDVRESVMRSVQLGRDLQTVTRDLEHWHKLTRHRASLIARDQNNKATATITRVRQQEAGITRAVWMHSHAGKKPRPSHVAFDGHEYDVDKGAFLDGEWVWPGTAISCRCFSCPIIPGLD